MLREEYVVWPCWIALMTCYPIDVLVNAPGSDNSRSVPRMAMYAMPRQLGVNDEPFFVLLLHVAICNNAASLCQVPCYSLT